MSERIDNLVAALWVTAFVVGGLLWSWFLWGHWTADPVGAIAPTTTEQLPVRSISATWVTSTYPPYIKPTSPCAMSERMVRVNHGAEDDLCAAWIDRRGRVHVGPLSDAPAYARMVGE